MNQEIKKKVDDGIDDVELNKSIGSDNDNGSPDIDRERLEPKSKEKVQEIEESVIESEAPALKVETIQWSAKIGRYIAFAVDGGILCSQFTLTKLIKILESSQIDGDDEDQIQQEICYLLHIRRIGRQYERYKDASGS